MADVRAAYRAVNCAATRLAEGGCQCELMGQGAGNGWTVTVTCGSEVISFNIPPRNDQDGTGYGRDFTCEQLENDFRDILELLDVERSDLLPIPRVSWLWPSSFFVDPSGTPMHETTAGGTSAWISTYCNPVTGPPFDLQAGDVVLFSGPSAITHGQSISHSAIATGRGDEISHMWWTHEVQQHMIDDRSPTPRATDPAPQNGGYAVTRDSLAEIEQRFVDRTGTPFLTNSYTVWRIRDQRLARFDEFQGCP